MTPRAGFMPPTEGCLYPELATAVERAIIARFDHVYDLAVAGEPPIAALIADLEGPIHEAFYWRLAERSIRNALGPQFVRAGRREVPIRLYRSAIIYEAISPPTHQ